MIAWQTVQNITERKDDGMAFCNYCGNMIEGETRLCKRCGKETGAAAGDQNPYAPPKHSAAVPVPLPKLNPWQYYVRALKNYAVFNGRARRAEYWWFMFFDTIVMSIVTSIIDAVFNLHIGEHGVVFTLYHLATLVPYMSVTVRRLHDCDKSGWFMLIPIYGWPILPATAGTIGPNRSGPDPRHEPPTHLAGQGNSGQEADAPQQSP